MKKYKILNNLQISIILQPAFMLWPEELNVSCSLLLTDQERWQAACSGGKQSKIYVKPVTVKEGLRIVKGNEETWDMMTHTRPGWCFTCTVSFDNTWNIVWGWRDDWVCGCGNWRPDRLSCQDSTACEHQSWDLELDSNANVFPLTTPPVLLFDHHNNPSCFKTPSIYPINDGWVQSVQSQGKSPLA